MSKATKLVWQRNQRRQFAEDFGFSTASNYAVGGSRQQILERDGYRCIACGMTDEDHRAKWSRPLTIDHKDRNKKNNDPSNLQTLCLSCHGKKDMRGEKNGQSKLTSEQVKEILNSNLKGVQLAKKFNVSQATISSIRNGQRWFHAR